MGYVKWNYEILDRFCQDVFETFGFSSEDSETIKDVLLTADLFGIESHGMLRSALEKEAASLAAKNCTPLDEAELRMILARLDASENEKIRGDLDRDLHIKIGKMAGNPMIFSVLSASSQLMENIITGIRGYLMQKNNSVLEIDEQHHLLVDAIAEKDEKQAKKYMQEHMDSVERYIEEIAKKEQL